MNGKIDGFKKQQIPAFVLDHFTPNDVAQEMIANGQKAAFYIFDMDEAYRRIRQFQELMPRVKIFYAMKSNDTDMMLRLAAATGLGFDCASPGEVYKVRKLGVKPDSIIYAVPCKSHEDMIYVKTSGVKHTTFDSSCELKKIKKSWPEAKLLIRIRINSEAEGKLGLKFGCDFETEAIELLDEADSLGLDVVGVAFHAGGVCYSLDSYLVALRRTKILFDHEAKKGRQLKIIDVGGAFTSHSVVTIEEVSYLINDTLSKLFPDPNVQIIAEPGRYLCNTAFKMYCQVLGARKAVLNNVSINMIFLNNGIYGSMRYNEKWHKVSKLQRSNKIESEIEAETILWGPSCDSLDIVLQECNIKLPQCFAGDWLVVEHHGAYTLTRSSKFSSLVSPLVQPVLSMQLWNYLKKSSAFQESDFILNPSIFSPLPSVLPPVCDTNDDLETLVINPKSCCTLHE